MPNTITSQSMLLPVPVVGTDPGPQFAVDINACMALIDAHDHSENKGVQVTPDGLDINSDLTFAGNSATNVKKVAFSAQSSALTGTSLLYAAPNGGSGVYDLYFNDGAGNEIPITQNGAVVATVTNIPGESYAGGVFTWVQGNGSTTPANFDIGGIVLRPNTAGTTRGVNLIPAAAIASQYSIELPLLPVSKKIVTLTSTGLMVADYDVDGSTIEVSSNTIRVKDLGITNAKIANLTITGAKVAAATITANKLASPLGDTQTFNANGTYTVPANATLIMVTAVGGGGGGAGSINGADFPNGFSGGGGGAGGCINQGIFSVTPGDTHAVTIGAGGTGGTGGIDNATDGGGTSLGSLIAANGGRAGSIPRGVSSSGTSVLVEAFIPGYGGCGGGGGGAGGNGGVTVAVSTSGGSSGFQSDGKSGGNAAGAAGGSAVASTGTNVTGGGGGASYGDGANGSLSSGVSASANTGGGGGGAGATSAARANGGNGGSGKLIVVVIG